MLIITESYRQQNTDLFSEIKSEFEHFSNAEIDEVKESIEKLVLSEKAIPIIRDMHFAYQSVQDQELEPDGKINYKLLQHWLLRTEKKFENWRISSHNQNELIQSSKILAKGQSVTFESLKRDILELLKSRNKLSSFENELLNVIIKETDKQLLKKDFDQRINQLDNELLGHYLAHATFPKWVEKKEFKTVIELFETSLMSDPVALTKQIRSVDKHAVIFQKTNFLSLVKTLDKQPISRFYQNILIAEKFFEKVLKGIFGVQEQQIQLLRKRMFQLGLETSFKTDSVQFFTRLKFISGQMSKLPEEHLQKLIFYVENDLDNRSPNLLFWNDHFNNRKELSRQLDETNEYSDFSKSWFDLLVEKRDLSESQQTLFSQLLKKVEKDKFLESKIFKNTLNDNAIRSRIVEHVNEAVLIDLLKSEMNAHGAASLDFATKQLTKLKMELSTTQFQTFRNKWFDQLFSLYAIGALKSLNSDGIGRASCRERV